MTIIKSVNFTENFQEKKGRVRTVWKNEKKISSNQLFSNFFSKTVTFTKFLPEMRESKFP